MSNTDFETQKMEEEVTASALPVGAVNDLSGQDASEELEKVETPKASVEGDVSNVTPNGAVKILQDDINQLRGEIIALEKLFETKILHTEHEEKIVDQMHRELQKYKEDMYSQLVRPILLDVIEIRDSILRVSGAHQSKPEKEQAIPLPTFEMYAADVQEILEKNNIEIFKSEKGSDFVPIRHRAIKKISTSDKNLHGKVAESLSDGYNYLGKIISSEKIAIYFYTSQDAQLELNNGEEQQNG